MSSCLTLSLLIGTATGYAVTNAPQIPLGVSGSTSIARHVPGGSIVKLCPESRETDLLAIERMVNEPQIPYLNEEQDIFIWGTFAKPISVNSTVDYQINATANTGDFGALNGTFRICDYLEKMEQPGSKNGELACPPHEGAVFMDYAAWFVDFLVAPGQWSVKFDAKTPEGERIYCLQSEFDLQCPPWHEGPECLRDTSEWAEDTAADHTAFPFGERYR